MGRARTCGIATGWLVAAALAGPVWAADPNPGTAATGDEAGTQSLSDINKSSPTR